MRVTSTVTTLAISMMLAAGGAQAQDYMYAGQWGSEGPADGEFTVIGGIAEDAGVVYVTDFVDALTCRIQKFDHDGNLLDSVTEWGEARAAVGGIEVTPAGFIYTSVAQAFQKLDASAQALFELTVADLTGHTVFQPYDVAVDSTGHVYVTEVALHRINKFTGDGVFVSKWGGMGSAEGQLNFVGGVAVGPGDAVIVSDMMNNRIQVFNSSGQFLAAFGAPGTGEGQFNLPHGLDVDAAGNIYVADALNQRIQVFTADGEFVTMWGERGSGDGQFDFPADVAVTPDGATVFVVDRMNHRIQRFVRQ